jgi:formate dehydrogenase
MRRRSGRRNSVDPRLRAQARYAVGTCEILKCWFSGQPIRDEYLIVADGRLAGTDVRSYTVSAPARELAVGRK